MIAAVHNKHLNFTCFNDTDSGKNIALFKNGEGYWKHPYMVPCLHLAVLIGLITNDEDSYYRQENDDFVR